MASENYRAPSVTQSAELAEQQGVELPPLPASRGFIQWHSPQAVHQAHGFTSTQMQDYARAALAATSKQQVGEVQGDAREAIDARFRSGNSIPVERASVPREEWESLKAALAYRQPGSQVPTLWVSSGQLEEFRNGSASFGARIPARLEKAGLFDTPLYAAPPAQGIGLGQFREAVQAQFWLKVSEARRSSMADLRIKEADAERIRLLAIIDSAEVPRG